MGMSNAAQHIRNDLKAAGFKLKLFSVRSSKTGSVTVEIRDASIAKSRITEIASRHEHIDRDNATGEILAGGNTFVTVRYARDVLAAAGAELTLRLRAGEREFGTVHVEATSAHTWQVWSSGAVGRMLRQISPEGGEGLAELLAERGELGAVCKSVWSGSAAQAERAAAHAQREQAWSAHLEVSLDLLRRAVSQLEHAQAVTARIAAEPEKTFELTFERRSAADECESLATLAVRELNDF